MNTTSKPPEGLAPLVPENTAPPVTAGIQDETRSSIEEMQLREELHQLMRTELRQPTAVIARPSGQYTNVTKFPTVLPPKFYALLGLEESEGARYMYCVESNGRVNLGLYPINNGQENIVYSFSTIVEGNTTS
jgi:hypothetical protein